MYEASEYRKLFKKRFDIHIKRYLKCFIQVFLNNVQKSSFDSISKFFLILYNLQPSQCRISFVNYYGPTESGVRLQMWHIKIILIRLWYKKKKKSILEKIAFRSNRHTRVRIIVRGKHFGRTYRIGVVCGRPHYNIE